jgi:hypothetical protein
MSSLLQVHRLRLAWYALSIQFGLILVFRRVSFLIESVVLKYHECSMFNGMYLVASRTLYS